MVIIALFLATLTVLAMSICYGFVSMWRSWSNREHRKHVLMPLTYALMSITKERRGVSVSIPRGMLMSADEQATGTLTLPRSFVGSDGEREQVLTAVRSRLKSDALSLRWKLDGAVPGAEIYTPKQPPALVGWALMMELFDTVSPYLGESANGPINWDLGDDSPHVAVLGGGGSGKSELIAWIVAQFMHGGAGTVVLDPKYSSHRWLMSDPKTLYCTEPAMVHDTILWLDEELRARGRRSQRPDAPEERKIIVLLEERNSMQSLLRDYWRSIKVSGMPMMSPALTALDRLASQGRSLNINVILAAQEGAKVDIGSRSNFGAFALAGRLPVNVWRLAGGPGTQKPAITSKPGRFGWMVAGHATVFQAAYPDLKAESTRLLAWATSGEVERLDVKAMMQQQEVSHPFPSSAPVTPEESSLWSLADFAEAYALEITKVRSRKARDIEFPEPAERGQKNAGMYRAADLEAWLMVNRHLFPEPADDAAA
jgi:hypothetical protein